MPSGVSSTSLLTRKIKDVRFILVYPVICLVTLVAVLIGHSQTLMIAGAFIIGWAGAGDADSDGFDLRGIPNRSSQNHKVPQQHPSALSDSSRHRTPASASSGLRRASGVYMLFSLP